MVQLASCGHIFVLISSSEGHQALAPCESRAAACPAPPSTRAARRCSRAQAQEMSDIAERSALHTRILVH